MNGKEIKKYREDKGWTQQYLANKIGVGVRTIQNYENDGVVPESRGEILRSVFFDDSNENVNNLPLVKYLEKDGVKISINEIAKFISKNEASMETDDLYLLFKAGIKKEAIIEYYEKRGFNSSK